MIGVRDIKEEDEVEEGEVHLEEELLPCKQIKEEQSRITWMLYKNVQQGQEEGQHLQLYEQQQQGAEQQQQFSQRQEVKEEQQEQLQLQQEQQQIIIQELEEQQRQQQHRQRQEQQDPEHQQQKLQQQQQQVEQHQQQRQHLREQQWEAWQEEHDPLEIEQPLGGEEVHLMPNLLTLKPEINASLFYTRVRNRELCRENTGIVPIEQDNGLSDESSDESDGDMGDAEFESPETGDIDLGVIFLENGRMTTAEEEEEEDEDEDDEEINALIPSNEKTRDMEKQYLVLLPLYEDTCLVDAFTAAADRGSSAVPSNILEGIMTEQRQLREAVKKEWKEQLCKKTETTLRGLEQQLKALQVDDEEKKKAGGGVGSKRKALEEKVNTTMAELLGIKETKLDKFSFPPRDTPLDWERISTQGFEGARSAMECQLMWNHLLHPSINRKAFTKKEDLAIRNLVSSKGNDWDAIAKALWTQRTGFLVMQRWMSRLKPTAQRMKWNNKDTKKLLDAVSLLHQGKDIPWSQVQQHLPHYTKTQIRLRWHQVNPESSGFLQLTQEETSVLVKATYLFGLDFSNIGYFLPRHSSAQVRKKLKSFILNPLLYKPWTRQEDKILLTRGEPSQGSFRKSNWHLPCRRPCQCMCRYLTLKLWQALPKEDEEMLPPPFFPIANTTDSCKIENLRELLMVETQQDEKRLNEAVEDCRKDIQMQLFLEDLVAFRASQQLITPNRVRERVKKLPLLQRSSRRSNKDAGTFNMFFNLMDRFLEPGHWCEPTEDRSEKAIKSLKVLSEIMLLQPRPTEEEEEEEEASKREAEEGERATRKRKKANGSYEVTESGIAHKKKTRMSRDDSDLWELLVEKWEEEEEQRRVMGQGEGNTGSSSVGSAEGGGGSGGMSEASVAVCSVFDMPYIPPNNTTLGAWNSIDIHLSVLTEMARGNFVFQNYLPDQLDTMTEAQLSGLLFYSKLMPLEVRTCEWQGPKGRKKTVLHNDICSPDFNTYSRLPQKRKIKLEAASSQQGSWTFPAVFSTPATLPQQDSAPAAATTVPSTSMGGSNKEESTHQVLTRDKADELLFHRMLSLFYWPVVMMPEKPADEHVCKTEQRVKLQSKKEKTTKRRITKRWLKWSYCFEQEMGVEKTMQKMEDLEKSLRVSQAILQEKKERTDRQRGMKRKRPEEPELDTAQPQGPKQPEMQSAPVQDKVVDEESQSGTPSEDLPIKYHQLNICRIKRKLMTLTKSLRMKEVWEKRRQGVYAPRKTRNGAGSKSQGYRPRKASTRRRKRAMAEEESDEWDS